MTWKSVKSNRERFSYQKKIFWERSKTEKHKHINICMFWKWLCKMLLSRKHPRIVFFENFLWINSFLDASFKCSFCIYFSKNFTADFTAKSTNPPLSYINIYQHTIVEINMWPCNHLTYDKGLFSFMILQE